MEQEQQTGDLDSTPPKNSLFAFFDAVKLKHIVLFLLCLLFLGILIGGGNNQNSPKRLAIKSKKCKPVKNDNFADSKKEVANSIEGFAAKSKDKIGEIGTNLKNKTEEAAGNTTNALKQGQEKVGKAIANTNENFKEGKSKIGELLTGKGQKIKDIDSDNKDVKFGKVKPQTKAEVQKNGFVKDLKSSNEENVEDEELAKTEPKNEQNNVTGSTEKSNSSSIELEIDMLKKELNQLKSRINQLSKPTSKQNNNATLNNDEDFINQRIEFWQSIKENTQNQ